ncbi:putative multicopper oxidase family protein [Lyophyllum shimeji]|uniref:Multicopper oxidase family protein n=1 Tax=Lyophyllum shimeji TaxID=47721 RepID=A0A9P3PQD5_LYOSH|nr:putative multicopper oxidase family protein [Lyophyllum shimeji]
MHRAANSNILAFRHTPDSLALTSVCSSHRRPLPAMLKALLLVALSASCLVPVANGSLGPRAQLTVANKDIAPDGYKRSSVLVNGQLPAPLIRAEKGSRYLLNVVNNLTDDTMSRSTGVHWHGIFNKGTPYADGTPIITQCPITPEKSFLYDFTVLDEAGTFWYHSHFRTQYCDGLRGPLVIYDPNDPHKALYDVDDESTVMTLGDWYHKPSPAIVKNGHPESNSTLINGKGRYPGGPKVPLAVVNVQRYKRYRIRLVSISCDPNFEFEIDGHRLTIIEADGHSTHPYTVDSLTIFAAQRYSFILNADQPVGNYWIRAMPNHGASGLDKSFAGGINSAILRYKGAPQDDPTSSRKRGGEHLQEAKLRPMMDARAPGKPYPGGADVNLNLDVALRKKDDRFTVNGASFEDPDVPVLLQILSGARSAKELLPEGSVYPLPRNKVVEITFPITEDNIENPHPFHMHGHVFHVIKSAGNDSEHNYIDPPKRDTVSLGHAGSNVTIRFVSNNPGPWILHCHINWHLERGLAVVLADSIDDFTNKTKYSDTWKELCPTYNKLPSSMKHP